MGGEAKVTVMVLRVDLGCSKCYKKIKKVLCSTPQCRDQMYDEKSNTVMITVICCTPEKVADKIRSKAGGTIKSLDIKPSQPPARPPAEKPKEGPPPQADKPKQGPPPPAAEKPKAAPPPTEKPKGGGDGEKPKPPPQQMGPGGGGGGGGNSEKPKKVDVVPIGGPPPQQQSPMGPPPQPTMKPMQAAAFMSPESIPVAGYPSIFPPVVYYDGGPYYQNQGMAAMAPPQRFPQQPIYQYDGYYGRPVADSYGGGRGYRADYFSEENPSSCSVM
uniref:Uncharacterized protein n=1 Tax=Kalanchoe fedtschenkoi TaxID=63787 RepID=A0A7N0UW99_KALFE